MSKISIVGVEGSGKTTLMAAFGEKYERPDKYGYGLKATNARTFRLVKALTAHMRQGRWPSATELGTLTNLDWVLYRREGMSVENICDVSFLDFAGEVYRKAFGDQPVDEASRLQVAKLREYVNGSDALVVLVNLKDIIDGDPTSERTTEMLWVTQGIIDFAVDTCKIKHIVLAFSQFNVYYEAVESVGGLQAAYVKYLPHVEGIRPNLSLLALSAVDRTMVDADGYEVPASDFASTGLDGLLEWIVSTVPGREDEIRKRRELPQTLWRSLTSAQDALRNGNASVSPKWMEVTLGHFCSLPSDERESVASETEIAAMVEFVRMAIAGEQRLSEMLEQAQKGNFEFALSELEKDVATGIVLESRAQAVYLEIETQRLTALAEESRRYRRRRFLRGCIWGAVALFIVMVGGFITLKYNEPARLWVESEWVRQQAERSVRKLIDGGSYPGEEVTILLQNEVPMTFCWCPATTSEDWKSIFSDRKDYFMMGSPTSEDGHDSDETQHRVKLTQGFWMGKYEVTQRQWECVMRNNPSRFRGADRPVENISWEDCHRFIQKINAEGRVTVSLPTEAQWEYACRAGTTTPFNFGSSLNGDKANCDGNYPYGTMVNGRYRSETAPVGLYAPNAWGLYDMHGNVWEWCEDWYGYDYYGQSPTHNPTGQVSGAGAAHVIRGGCWYGIAQSCRSANRNKNETSNGSKGVLGFRLVCSLPIVAAP